MGLNTVKNNVFFIGGIKLRLGRHPASPGTDLLILEPIAGVNESVETSFKTRIPCIF